MKRSLARPLAIGAALSGVLAPFLTDALVTHARRELEREKKPSVMEKLQSAEMPLRTAAKAAVPEL